MERVCGVRVMRRKGGERVCRLWPILLIAEDLGLVRVEVAGSNASVAGSVRCCDVCLRALK